MHLDRDQVELALDPGVRQGSEVDQHLRTCSECQARLDQARQEDAWIRERLGTLDHVLPPITARSVVARAGRSWRGWQRLAASFILALAAAGAAYAAPGSPLPGLIRRLVHGPVPAPSSRETPPLPDTRISQAGIAVAPGDRLTIEFASPEPGDTAVVSLSDDSEVTIRASGGKTTFASEPNGLIVRQSGGPARFEILVPRDARWVKLAVGQRRLWLKAGARVDGSGSSGGGGRYVLPLSPESPSPAP
jgi:anti-sigma factor RsiW